MCFALYSILRIILPNFADISQRIPLYRKEFRCVANRHVANRMTQTNFRYRKSQNLREHISQYRRGLSLSAISHIAYIFFDFPGDRSQFHKRVSLP